MREIVAIHRDAKGTAAYLEPAVERIEAFSRWAGGDPIPLGNQVWKAFAERSPSLGLWVVVEDGRLIGHLLADIRTWDGRYVGWVLQLQLDGGHDAITAAEVASTLAAMDTWISTWNAQARGAEVREILFVTPHETEAWAKKFGFFKKRDLRSRPVPAS